MTAYVGKKLISILVYESG